MNDTLARIVAVERRAAQYLIPPCDSPGARADAFERAQALLLQASAEFMRSGREDLAQRVHEAHHAAEEGERDAQVPPTLW